MKVAMKYIEPLVIKKIIEPYKFLLMVLGGKILRGLLEYEILKPPIITAKTSIEYRHLSRCIATSDPVILYHYT